MQSTDFKWKAPTSKASALNGKCLDGSDEQKNINLKCRFGIRFAITQMTHLGYRVGDQSAVGHLGEPDEAPCVYPMVCLLDGVGSILQSLFQSLLQWLLPLLQPAPMKLAPAVTILKLNTIDGLAN